MATLSDLATAKALASYEATLRRNEHIQRYVYFSPSARNWAEQTLATAKASTSRGLTPSEQMVNILHDFIIGRPMAYGSSFHPLDPVGHQVWEFKTADVRLVGWFPAKRFFVVVCGRFKSELLKRKLYDPCIECVLWFRENLDLDPPKSVDGVSYHDVL